MQTSLANMLKVMAVDLIAWAEQVEAAFGRGGA